MIPGLPNATVFGKGGVVPIAWPPARRAQLPPFPPVDRARNGRQVWASSPYRTELAPELEIPTGPDIHFYRANFCGHRVRGLPPVKDGKNATVPGGDTSLFYSPHLPRYPVEAQHEACKQTAEAGLTHIFLHLPNAIDVGGDSAGLPLKTFIGSCHLAQSYGLWVDVALIGGGMKFGPRDATWDYYKGFLGPIIDELIAERAMDLCCVGMQLDGWNSPYGLRTIVEGIGSRVKSQRSDMLVASHWLNHSCSWFGKDHNGDSGFSDRFDYWRHWRKTGQMDWAYFQADVTCPVDDLEGRITELLKACDIVSFEITAQGQFDPKAFWNHTPDDIEIDEAHGDLKGYLALCATGGPFKHRGYGNGARLPDGTPL